MRSTRVGSKIFGRYSLGQRRMPGMCEPSLGWQPTIWISLRCSFRKRDTPMIVPVVPIALTKCVISCCRVAPDLRPGASRSARASCRGC